MMLLAYFGLNGWQESVGILIATVLAHLPAAYWYYNHQEEINSDWSVPRKTYQEERLIQSSIGISIGWLAMMLVYAAANYGCDIWGIISMLEVAFCNLIAGLLAYGIVFVYKIIKYDFMD
jgi:hypothetical protein